MAGKRGRTAGFRMTEEHRGKIRITALLNRLQSVAEGKVANASVGDTVRAAEILLRKAMPDLSAQEITGDVQSFVMRLPEPAQDTDTWERTNSLAKPLDDKDIVH